MSFFYSRLSWGLFSTCKTSHSEKWYFLAFSEAILLLPTCFPMFQCIKHKTIHQVQTTQASKQDCYCKTDIAMHYETYVILPLDHPVSNICRGTQQTQKNDIVILATSSLNNFGRYAILWYTLKKQINH